MKRKTAAFILGVAITAGALGGGASAMTYANEMGDVPSLGEEEREKLENRQKVEIQETIAYLEKYGISYEFDEDVIYYQGRTVRCLTDEKSDSTCMMIQMPRGEIDVYTERGDDGRLTGVREATQEEYDRRTERIMSAGSGEDEPVQETFASDGSVIFYIDGNGQTVVSSEGDAIAAEDEAGETALPVEATEETADSVTDGENKAVASSTEDADGSCQAADLEDDWEKEWEKTLQEYEAAGITQDGEGYWIWQGEKVNLLLDENGSVSSNLQEAGEKGLYILVTRKADGSIDSVKRLTAE